MRAPFVDSRSCLLAACALGFLGVAGGAFGAHALRGRLSPEMLAVFETGVRYQMYHTLALLMTGILLGRTGSGLIALSGALFFTGTLIFSGSLYALVLSGVRAFGAVTPLGGLLLLCAWICLGTGLFKSGT